MFQKDLFKDKIVLVTGGRSGIGYEVSKQYLELGAKVYIASRKEEQLKEATKQLQEFGDCLYFPCDIRDLGAVQAMADAIKDQQGRLDILVNNAGGQFLSYAEKISVNGWNSVVNNNLNGTWFVTQTMANTFFIPQKSGTILNMIMNVYRGFPGMAHSAAARGGVETLTKTLAVEWSKYNIQVNAVAPGIIYSSGLKTYPKGTFEGIAQKIPAKRLGTVEEVANLSLFLTTPNASYITGETVYIDGGSRLWGDPFSI